MAGTSYDIVILSSSPPAHDLYAPSSPLNGSPRASPRRVAMPASPLLAFSPPVSPPRKTSGASAHNPRRADIPPDAIRGFATVGSLVRSEHFAQQFDDDTAGKEQAHSRRGSREHVEEVAATKKKPSKQAATPSTVDGDTKSKPKPRARKTKADKATTILDPELRLPAPKVSPFLANEDAEAAIEPPNEPTDNAPKLTKSGKPRKPRAKKEKIEAEDVSSKPKKTRVTKPKSVSKAGGKLQREDACIESAHFRKTEDGGDGSSADVLETSGSATTKIANTNDASIWEVPHSPKLKKKPAPKQRPADPVVKSLELDEAVSRRRDWTPPRDTVIASPFTDSIGKENKPIDADTSDGNFTHMISNFAYAQALPAQVASTVADSTTTTTAVSKRRRVELVDVPGNQTTSRNSSPDKGKAPKKKPRTITDIATEQYQPRAVQLDPSDVASEFFQSRTAVTKVPLNDAPAGEAPPKKPPRKRSTSQIASGNGKGESKAKTKKVSAKVTTKSKPIAEKLLSPGSALMRMNKQDLLFGTSSQLALEESPTMVRQIQHAIKESEVEADNSFSELLAPPPRWPKLDKVMGKRSLWDASSRDVEGGLLEHIKDVYIPEFDRTQDFPLLMDGTNDEPDAAPPFVADTEKVEAIEQVLISSDAPTPPRSTSRVSQIKVEAAFDTPDHVMGDSFFEDIDDFDCQPPPSNQNVESENSFTNIDDILPMSVLLTTSPPSRPRPPASAPATGSPKKHRGWPPKSQSAIPSTSASPAFVDKPKAVKPKTPKSALAPPTTPAKGSGRFIDIDEILDSEDETMQALSPTPPRIRNFQNSEALPLFCVAPSRAKKSKSKASVDPKVARVHIVPSAHLEWATFKSSAFSSITSHIRSVSPTRDPSKPSWHEKILMYDPIVLEDFTAYLNANTSIRAWKRATKIQTKAWNKEMKAIGEEAIGAIEGGGNVLAVEKELEAWQIQAWCESMSVCCIWGEGRGKGGVRKGFY